MPTTSGRGLAQVLTRQTSTIRSRAGGASTASSTPARHSAKRSPLVSSRHSRSIGPETAAVARLLLAVLMLLALRSGFSAALDAMTHDDSAVPGGGFRCLRAVASAGCSGGAGGVVAGPTQAAGPRRRRGGRVQLDVGPTGWAAPRGRDRPCRAPTRLRLPCACQLGALPPVRPIQEQT